MRGEGGGPRGKGYIILMADPHCCIAETNNIVRQLSSN